MLKVQDRSSKIQQTFLFRNYVPIYRIRRIDVKSCCLYGTSLERPKSAQKSEFKQANNSYSVNDHKSKNKNSSKIAKGLQSVKVFTSTKPEKPKKLERISGPTGR